MKIAFGFPGKAGFYTYSSISNSLKRIADHFIKQGHEVLLIDKHIIKAENHLSREFFELNNKFFPYMVKRRDRKLGGTEILFEGYDFIGSGKYACKTKIKTGFFVFALTPLPESITKTLPFLRNPIFVTGKQSYEEMINMGLDVHPYVDGINLGAFYPPRRPIAELPLRLLWVGGCAAASAPDIALNAYYDTFSNEDETLLTMISNNANTSNLEKEILSKRPKDFIPPKVLHFGWDYSPREMGVIYRDHSALIMPIRSHSGCLQVPEAMACGLPVVTTKWTGPTNYADDGEVIWVDHEIEDVRPAALMLEKEYKSMIPFTPYFNFWEKEVVFKWAKPDVRHLSNIMWDMYGKPVDTNLSRNAILRSNKFSWDPIVKNIEEILKERLNA